MTLAQVTHLQRLRAGAQAGPLGKQQAFTYWLAWPVHVLPMCQRFSAWPLFCPRIVQMTVMGGRGWS
jgi:hypothetical protein